MDGSAEFRAFFKALAASRPSQGVLRPPPTPQSCPQPVRGVLERVLRQEGTAALATADLEILGDPAFSGSIRDQLRTLLVERRNLDRELQSLIPPQDSLLVPCLLVVLHHPRIRQIRDVQSTLLEGYRAAIAAHAIIQAHRLGPREKQAQHELQATVRAVRNDLAVLVNALVDAAKGFTLAYQFFCHSEIDALAELETGWRTTAIDSARVSDPPTPQELNDFGRFTLLEAKLATANDERTRLREELTDLQAQRSSISGETARRQLRAEIAEARQKLTGFNRIMGAMRSERRILARSVAPRAAVIRRFLAAAGQPPSDRAAAAQRDIFLREHDALAAPATPGHGLLAAGDADRWRNYQLLLAKLADGDGALSLQLLSAAWLGRYGHVNVNRDVGLRVPYFAGTYTRHGLGAIDLMAEAGAEVRCVTARSVTLPRRLMEANGIAGQPPRFAYHRSTIAQMEVRASSDREDIFFKIAYGLLRRQDQRLSATDISGIMNETGFTNRGPAYLSDPRIRRFDPARIIAGLAYFNLTEEPDAEDVNAIRDDILSDIAAFVRTDLRLEPGRRIFRDTDRSADAGRVGVLRLIAHRDRGAVLRSVMKMMTTQIDLANGLVHRLWRLLWGLVGPSRSPAGLLQHGSGGQSVMLDHLYRPAPGVPPGEPPLIVRVLYSHLHTSRLAGQRLGDEVRPGAEVGEVGLTGNAAGAHLHLQITLHQSQNMLGGVLPHEYFEGR